MDPGAQTISAIGYSTVLYAAGGHVSSGSNSCHQVTIVIIIIMIKVMTMIIMIQSNKQSNTSAFTSRSTAARYGRVYSSTYNSLYTYYYSQYFYYPYRTGYYSRKSNGTGQLILIRKFLRLSLPLLASIEALSRLFSCIFNWISIRNSF